MNWMMRLAATAIAVAMAGPATAAPFSYGDIFAAVNNGNVNHYSSSGTFIQTLNTGQVGYTTGMAVDSAGNLNVTNFSAGNITRFAPNGTILAPNPFVSPGSSPESIVFDASGQMYVGRAGGSFQRYSAAGVLQQTYSTPVNTDWLDLAANQTTMFYNDESGIIRRMDVTTNTQLANFANNNDHGGTNSLALRIRPNGNVLSAASTIVLEYDSSGNVVTTYDVAGIDSFFALNLDPDGTSFWTGDINTGNLYKFAFGGATPLMTINASPSAQNLYGVAIYGEAAVGCGDACGGSTPTPEPASLALLGTGIVALAIRRRRNSRI